MPESPEVTVVIPTCGRWSYLSLTLGSVLRQEDVELEVIVSDDGSRDETVQRLRALDDPRIRTIRQERPHGVAHARNVALAEARGEWVAFLDDDDLWAPRKLRVQLDVARNAGASFAYGAAVVIDSSGTVVGRQMPPPDPADLPRKLFVANVIPAPGSNIVVRTSAMRRLGGFDEAARFDEWDMWIRLSEAERGAACSDVLVGYRRHEKNRALGDLDSLRPGHAYLAHKHRALAAELQVGFNESVFARWLAFIERRAGRRRQAARTCLDAAWAQRNPANLARAVLILFGPWAAWDWWPPRPPATPPWLELYQADRATAGGVVPAAPVA
jgi:glycosyltransferase involved in cell wall biosynthesis